MSPANAPALRFQRAELREKAGLSPPALACLNTSPGPKELVASLGALDSARDAVNALAQILPHRQSVWWGCLALRLLPDLAERPAARAAVEGAEAWVQTGDPAAALRAGPLAQSCEPDDAAYWVAMAAHWSGPSIAPPEQHAIPPAPHLPGIAVRTSFLFLLGDPAIEGRLGFGDLLEIGTALMNGDLGRTAQTMLRTRLAGVR